MCCLPTEPSLLLEVGRGWMAGDLQTDCRESLVAKRMTFLQQRSEEGQRASHRGQPSMTLQQPSQLWNKSHRAAESADSPPSPSVGHINPFFTKMKQLSEQPHSSPDLNPFLTALQREELTPGSDEKPSNSFSFSLTQFTS